MESGIIYNEKYLEKALKINKNLGLNIQEVIKGLLKRGLKEIELATDYYLADKSNLALMHLTTNQESHFTLDQERYRPIVNLEFKIALALFKMNKEAEYSNHHIIKSVNDYMLDKLVEGKLPSKKDVVSLFLDRCSNEEEINLVKKAYLDFTHLTICPNFGRAGEREMKEVYDRLNNHVPLTPITDKDFDFECSDWGFTSDRKFSTYRMPYRLYKIIKKDGEIEYRDVRNPVLEIKGNLSQYDRINELAFIDIIEKINVGMPYYPPKTSPFTLKIDAYASPTKMKGESQIFFRINSVVNNLNGEEIEINKVYLQKYGKTELIPEFDYRCYEKELYRINNIDKIPIYECEMGYIFMAEPNHLVIRDGVKKLDNFSLGKIISLKEIDEVTIPNSVTSIGLNLFSELILTKDNPRYEAPKAKIYVRCSKEIHDMIKENSSKKEFEMLIFDNFIDKVDIGPEDNNDKIDCKKAIEAYVKGEITVDELDEYLSKQNNSIPSESFTENDDTDDGFDDAE